MTSDDEGLRDRETTLDCWKTVGVDGAGNCPELETAVHCRNCAVFREAGQRLLEGQPPENYVQEQTFQLARELPERASGSSAMTIFRIGDEWFALDVESMVEVAKPRIVHRIPHRTDRRLLGLANIRGELQLCISLRAVLGISGHDRLPMYDTRPGQTGSPTDHSSIGETASPPMRLLIAQGDSGRWAFAVDEVAGVHGVDPADFGPVPSTVARREGRLAKAVFQWKGKRVGQLDHVRLFDSLGGHVR